MRVKKRCDIQIWRASPNDVEHWRWREFTSLLDLAERSQAFKFRHEADRKAYVLAHGLRRLALADLLNVPPTALVFRCDKNGKPELIRPTHKPIYFSHSHTRKGVVFAASADMVVGIDAESVGTEPLDFELLRPFMGCSVLPLAEKKQSPATSFYRYWTALEAFSKAIGTGLSQAHSCIRFVPDAHGHWNVKFDDPHTPEMTSMVTQAVVMPVTSPHGCVASLAVMSPPQNFTTASSFETLGEDITLVIHEKNITEDFEFFQHPSN